MQNKVTLFYLSAYAYKKPYFNPSPLTKNLILAPVSLTKNLIFAYEKPYFSLRKTLF